MSPEVKGISESLDFGCFPVDLASEQEFNSKDFDEQVKKVGDKSARAYSLKYVVINEQMFVFASTTGHAEAFQDIVNLPENIGHNLQSAGSIKAVFRGNETQRLVHGFSNSLLDRLPFEKSEQYKFGTLKDKLHEFFEFERPHIDVWPNAY